MPINIRNDIIEKNIERIQRQMIKDLGVDKLSKPQTINELIGFYDRKRGISR